jgi:hypothetical protein
MQWDKVMKNDSILSTGILIEETYGLLMNYFIKVITLNWGGLVAESGVE